MFPTIDGEHCHCQWLLLLLHAEHCSLKLQQGRDSGSAPGAVHLLVLVLLLLYTPLYLTGLTTSTNNLMQQRTIQALHVLLLLTVLLLLLCIRPLHPPGAGAHSQGPSPSACAQCHLPGT
jgi:hypothetical protein